MSKIKDYLMDIEEKIFDAVECGAKTDDEIYAYVSMFFTASRRDVSDVVRMISGELYE
jgi:hypothetical protein